MKERIIVVVVGAVLWAGVAAIPALADGGWCSPGGGTQQDCHIMVGGVSRHCKVYTEYNGINCQMS